MNGKRYSNTATIAARCLLLSRRNPDTFFASILLPVLMMLLFSALFGSLIHVEDISYITYIIPGVLLQCMGQGVSVTAIMMNRDLTSGMMSRFLTLPVQAVSILNGHILEALIRSALTSAAVLSAAFLLGFRPSFSLFSLSVFCLLLFGSILMLSWAAVTVGIAANSSEGASSLSAFMILLPYLSSGFVPAEALPKGLQLFARCQPMTPIIDTMRNALLGRPLEPEAFAAAMLWCVGLLTLFSFLSLKLLRKSLSR